MVDDIRDIAAFYNQDPEREHQRLVEHQLEYDLTWRILDRYLPESGRLLEVGAATGVYTLPLAQKGYEITAVDLSREQIRFGRQRVLKAGLKGSVRFLVSDVRFLGLDYQSRFDAVLLMGPLYHLVDYTDRRKALREVFMRLKSGGVIFSALISRLGILGDLMKNIPDSIEKRAEVDSLLAKGRETVKTSVNFRGYFIRASEIAPLHESVGFETLDVVGVEPAISADDASYNRLEGLQRELWLDLMERISGEPSILGASRHLQYIGKKP